MTDALLEETIGPLLKARDRIDAAIQAYLDKVATLRKRREAVSASIDIIRAGDDEIMSLPTLVLKNKTGKPRIVGFDEGAVEDRVLQILATGDYSFPQLRDMLDKESVIYSAAGLRRILKTSPKIVKKGDREQTRYKLAS